MPSPHGPRVQPFSSSSVVSPWMTARSPPRGRDAGASSRAKGVLADLVAGRKGYVTEEYLARNALILSWVLPDPPRVVIDVGCGYGALATAIAVLTEARVVGLDVLEQRAKAVRARPQAKAKDQKKAPGTSPGASLTGRLHVWET